MKVSEMMRQAIAIDVDTSIKDAAKIMSVHKINSLIVLRKEKVIGIITEEDLIKNFGSGNGVSGVMSKNIISIKPDETTNKARDLIKNNKIGIIPVIENGKLKGIISAKDLLIEGDSGDFLIE